jgi:hypothetical protein
LYQHFFHTVDSGLDFFLEGLANVLYDACRPLFIFNGTTIDVLVELCSVLHVEAVDSSGSETAAFAVVAEQMLQDVQQRLCYLTQNYVESHISGFVPTAADLDYPTKLRRSETSSGTVEQSNARIGTIVSNPVGVSTEVINPGWYPTVTRTLLLLSKLYRSVDRQAFRDLSLEIVQACLLSLDSALPSIVSKSGKQHGRLFMIMHLIVIREQLAPFDDIEFSRVEKYLDITGFLSSLKGATADLIEHRSTMLSDATATLFNFLQRTTPRILESKENSSVDLEKKLKQYCLEYIADASRAAVANLNSFNVMVDALPEQARLQLPTHPSATPAKVRELVGTATAAMQTEVASLPTTASAYLDTKTVEVLVGQVQGNVFTAFKRFHDVVSKSYSDDDLASICLPSFETIHHILKEPPPQPDSTATAPTSATQAATLQPIAPQNVATPQPALVPTAQQAPVSTPDAFTVADPVEFVQFTDPSDEVPARSA